MGIFETLLIYALVGVVAAAALLLKEPEAGAGRRAFLALTAVLFWPVHAPFLFGGTATAPSASRRFEARIATAEQQLLAALGKLEGVAEEVLAPEVAHVRGLATSLAAMARRLADMDALLAGPEFSAAAVHQALFDLSARGRGEGDARVQSLKGRLRNIERLTAMRDHTADELERALLKIEEMTSQMLLLKFAGKPDEAVVASIKDIARSVEDLAEGLLAAS